MDTSLFRWVLAVIAVLSVAGIYLYGQQQTRLRRHQEMVSDAREEVNATFIEDELIRDELESLTQIMRDDDIDQELAAVQMTPVGESRVEPATPHQTKLFLPDDLKIKSEHELISCHLCHGDLRWITGEEVLTAMDHVGLTLAQSGYLSYRTDGELMFQVASLSEPGYFTQVNQLEFATAGLNCFVDVELVGNPRRAYEMMLKKVDELVRVLNVKVYKPDRELLTVADVTATRDRLNQGH